MRPPNPGTSVQNEMKDAILQVLFLINFGDRAEEAAKIAEEDVAASVQSVARQ